ncbi:Retrovirus-related Pol polyprotein from transposon [Ceratobasidium sp. AG-Ba]|nr:Retrovirus-related Pol polyprotein from transposon [Ceratobasidium sp. AG-Ba]QRW02619.1 Retrovirus-related Pol polyprotein from transposon [Ceratobasidium sp. AG-Ba]
MSEDANGRGPRDQSTILFSRPPHRRVHRGDESGTQQRPRRHTRSSGLPDTRARFCIILRVKNALLPLDSSLFFAKTAYRDGQGKWRDANHRFITQQQAERLIAEAAAESQLRTPNPSVSPAPLAHSLPGSPLSVSTFGSLDSGSRFSFITVPPDSTTPQGYEPDNESDDPRYHPDSPRTPRRPRRKHSLTTTAPTRPSRPAPESESEFEPEPAASPTVVRRQGPSPLPSVAVLGLRTSFSLAQPPPLSTGPKTPPSLGSAAASVPVGPMSVSDALVQIHSLCGGPFYDDGQPKPEVEYRRNFIFATLGLSDEQIASLWANHLVYDGPAHDWYETLVSSSTGKVTAQKWSTLLPEIEKRWPTPARDPGATRRRHRARWREHKFDIQPMLAALGNESSSTKPHQAWAQHHKALGAALTMTDEDRVLQTLDVLPVYLLELLPKRDAYTDEWDELIKDIGGISSRLLLNRYNQQSLIDSMYTVTLSQPNQQPTTPRWRNARLDRSPPPPNPSTPAARRGSTVRFEDTPQAAPTAPAPTPNPFTRPQTPNSQPRDPPPHFPPVPPTPHTPGPVPSVLSRAQGLPEPPPVGARRVPDTPDDKARWANEVAHFKALYSKEPPSLRRPFPFRPGTYEQTPYSCTRCGMGDHLSYACDAEGPNVLDRKEQDYRRVLARKLRDDQRAGRQPSTPTPQQRVRDTAQLDFPEPEFDPDSDLGSGNE